MQKSIQDSVYQLLLDQIKVLGLESFYSYIQNEIRGINGTTFRFSGLSDLTSDQLKSFIKLEDWNDVDIIARGNVLTHLLNGHVMSVIIDDDLANRRLSGAIGIQLHKTPNNMKIETRNIRLKTF